jgi:L-cysteine:1D-myo-inositol 2-amino-2-deoxy-alpha-D-glucopyranoside ligase
VRGLRLYDTARQAVVPFEPAAGPGGTVTIYTCGITPYDAAHLGHAATYLAYDVLRRCLHDLGYMTRLVRNVTDVDDDLLRKARELGVYYLDLAAEEMARFSADMDALGLLPASSEPRATSAIEDILRLVEEVLRRGHAYRAGGAVYFDVSSWPAFGSLSHYPKGKMLALARERGGYPDDPNKADPLDFVLWQPSAPDEPSWPSPFGPGRPGWHVECSALALRELGTTIDLHGGGSDLIFPHHECEAAQSEAATGEKFVRHWAHAGLVHFQGAKMAKSTGNLVFVHDLLKSCEPAALRLALLAHHYRQDWAWEARLLDEAVRRLERWRGAAAGASQPPPPRPVPSQRPQSAASGPFHLPPAPARAIPAATALLDEVRAALDDDLDTPRALALVDSAAGAGAGDAVRSAAALLGVAV